MSKLAPLKGLDVGPRLRGTAMGSRLVAWTAAACIASAATARAAPPNRSDRAEAAVREIVARDLDPVLTVDDKKDDDRRFMSPDLYRLYTRHRRSLDVDPYTGTQDSSDYTLVGLASLSKSDTGAVVTVEFAVGGAPRSHPRLAYDMVLSQGRWQVQDIAYLGDGTSLHNLLNGLR